MKKVKTMKKINKLSSDESHHAMKVIMWWKSSIDESYQVMKVIKWRKLSSDESYQVMKVIKWWKLSSNESFLVMKLIWWWKLYSDESYLVMKVKEVEIVLKSDGWWRFACGDVFFQRYIWKHQQYWRLWSVLTLHEQRCTTVSLVTNQNLFSLRD